MLELRPICENCACELSPASTAARICSYECTFCAKCVETILGNICPNCGGNFVPRPFRPARNWQNDNFLGAHPAVTDIKHRPVDVDNHRGLVAQLAHIDPKIR
ncbi:MAG: DUF1272 domain-containing protein [Proteobacteria bacterium]|nr:MAG: DUF1272 domain-containing protein [Pseudomonadota bacterium]